MTDNGKTSGERWADAHDRQLASVSWDGHVTPSACPDGRDTCSHGNFSPNQPECPHFGGFDTSTPANTVVLCRHGRPKTQLVEIMGWK